jgi:hypothetical protein
LFEGFSSQVLDLIDDLDWRTQCAALRRIGDMTEARAKAEDAVERHLLYPRSMLPALIECGSLPPVTSIRDVAH